MVDNIIHLTKYINYYKQDDFSLIDPNNLIDEDERVWRCDCGSLLFVIKPDGLYCNQCGDTPSGWD